MSSKKFIIIAGLLALFIGSLSIVNKNKSQTEVTNNSEGLNILGEEKEIIVEPTKSESQIPTLIIDKSKTYTAILKTTEGEVAIELNAVKTPITTNNFISLARKGFYNETIFHRAIKGFMIQGGDPKGDGTGGPGYKFADEPFEGEYTRGTIAMANAGPNTNGSQFFIMHADYPLPKNYVIFGKVTKGIEVVDKIATAPVEASPMGEMSKPIVPAKILSVEILEK